jgi:hypothetical protein
LGLVDEPPCWANEGRLNISWSHIAASAAVTTDVNRLTISPAL